MNLPQLHNAVTIKFQFMQVLDIRGQENRRKMATEKYSKSSTIPDKMTTLGLNSKNDFV